MSHWGNLTADGRAALKLLFKANRRLNKAYLLQESFGQLWDYRSPPLWARRLPSVPGALRRQRLDAFERFARMVKGPLQAEAYCHEENKVPLGFVEGLNNKIRVIQRRAYGFRDEERPAPENPHPHTANALKTTHTTSRRPIFETA